VLYDVITTSDRDAIIRTSRSQVVVEVNGSERDEGSCQLQFERNDMRGTRLANELYNGTRTCPGLRRPLADSLHTDGYWQTQRIQDDILVLFSAFYDDRPAVGVTPWIRIQGVAKLANRTHYCHVWYSGCNVPYVTPLVVNTTGRDWGYTLNKVRYIQYMFSCRLPGTEPVPSHVSIVPDECSSASTYLPVHKPVRAEPDVEFGACVAIAFGSIAVEEFIEWIEFSRLLGITEFNVYDAGMINMTRVFDLYSRRGWLRVHNMPPPVLPRHITGSGNDPKTVCDL